MVNITILNSEDRGSTVETFSVKQGAIYTITRHL